MCHISKVGTTSTYVSWSPLSRYLASASLDWCVHIWDLANGPAQCVRTLRFTAPVSLVQFSPVSSRSLVVVLESREAYLIHFPTTLQGSTCEPQRIPLQGTDPISSACFDPSGDWIFIGTTKGGVASFSSDAGEVRTIASYAAFWKSLHRWIVDDSSNDSRSEIPKSWTCNE